MGGGICLAPGFEAIVSYGQEGRAAGVASDCDYRSVRLSAYLVADGKEV